MEISREQVREIVFRHYKKEEIDLDDDCVDTIIEELNRDWDDAWSLARGIEEACDWHGDDALFYMSDALLDEIGRAH